MNKDERDQNSLNSADVTVVVTQDDISRIHSGQDREDQIVERVRQNKKFRKKRKFFLFRRTVVDDSLELTEKSIRSFSETEEYDERDLTDVSCRYQIANHPFAAGGQGSISSAVDKILGCEVALKSLHKEICADEFARSSFFTEARVTASLNHPAIVPIHGLFGDSEKGLHLAMKLIDGYTLKDYLSQIVQTYEIENIHNFDERRSLRNRLDIFLRICDAIEYAHERKIIHRDLKPENIMIGKHHETYVTDWGIASRIGEPVPERLKGTPAYIAPEVLISKKADVRSDIYSLGVILFELVFLKRAFPGEDVSSVLARVKAGKHSPMRHLFKCRIEADLKAVILKAIAPDPAKRYQDMAHFSGDLRRYLANEEVSANPDNLFSRLGRWGVNHRRRMIFTVMFFLLLGIGGIAYTLHREIRGSWERNWKERAAGMASASALSTSSGMEQGIQKVEYLLETFRMNIVFSTLDIEIPGYQRKNVFVSLEQYLKNPPESFAYSPAYRMKIDLENICLFDFNKRKLDVKKFEHFSNSSDFMRKMLSELNGESLKHDEPLPEQYFTSGCVRTVYFALENGMFAVYPGIAEFPQNYYPPNRVWYKQAQYKDGFPAWTSPYYDIGKTHELVTTCSIAIKGMRNKFLGVAAVDFSLGKLADMLLRSSGRLNRFTLAKLLVNQDGKCLFTMSPRSGETWTLPDDFPGRHMFSRKYGTIVQKTPKGKFLYAFALIPSINTLYVECIDLDLLVEHIRISSI